MQVYDSHHNWLIFPNIVRHFVRCFLLSNLHYSGLPLHLSICCSLRVRSNKHWDEGKISQAEELRYRPRWRKIFTKHTTFWWSFISTVVQLLYTFGYYEVVQVLLQYKTVKKSVFDQIGFMPSEYKTAHYHTVLLTNTGIDSSKFDFGYLAIIFRVCWTEKMKTGWAMTEAISFRRRNMADGFNHCHPWRSFLLRTHSDCHHYLQSSHLTTTENF